MCKYCEEREYIPCRGFGEFEIVLDHKQPFLYTYVEDYDDGYPIEVDINFCPMCGRKL